MKYKEMMMEAKAKGLTSEKTMWESIESIEELLHEFKHSHPEQYWEFMRKQHGILWKGHYSDDYAEYDLKHLEYKDKDGNLHQGEHWTKDEVLKATAGKTFPVGTTDSDKWVAFNVMYADLHKVLDDEHILKSAYAYFFDDDDFDYTKGSKVWKLMS